LTIDKHLIDLVSLVYYVLSTPASLAPRRRAQIMRAKEVQGELGYTIEG
jgi:hypothetical protein